MRLIFVPFAWGKYLRSSRQFDGLLVDAFFAFYGYVDRFVQQNDGEDSKMTLLMKAKEAADFS